MEDDDEFGDLYTDVLRQFQPSSPLERPKLPSPKRPIDPNLQSDDEDILFGAPNSNPEFHFTTSHQSQTLASESKKGAPEPGLAQSSDSNRNLGGKQEEDQEVKTEEGLAERASLPTVLDSGDDLKSHGRGFEGPESGIDFVVEERDDEDDVLVGKDEVLIDKEENFENFDIEEPEPVIPGVSDAGDHRGDSNMDDWDSDSDDDLQIVLNDNNHHGPMVADRLVGTGDEDDEDGDPLVIVADSEPGHQLLEEQEWGEDAAQAADGERKEVGDAAKVNGGGGAAVVAPKIGYNSNYTYHPYHSQFKYVRPGAAPMPGAAPVGFAGAPGQVRPPVNMGPVAGFGRGDWRPTGIRGASPMQKPGFGMHVWGNNTAGRGFGSGLDFTLPSHKTIFEVEVDSFEEKPWRLPGLDVSDFFNFGLNEESWKDYCKQLEQLRMETTMQSKIRVYESGRTEQEYDPDLPPELAAAAGIRDISAETANLAKTDAGQSDVANGSSHVRPPLPTGRAIQVETGYGERLPSIDTRPPRIRDSDAIIEIVLQDSSNDGSSPGNDITEKLENDPSREDFRGGQDTEGNVVEEHSGLPQAYNSRKREMVGRRAPFMNSIHDNLIEGDGILSSPQESLVPYRLDPRGQTSAYPGRDVGTLHEDRQTKGRARDRSPIMTRSGSTLDKGFRDNNEEASIESIGGKHSHQLSSPGTVGSAEEPDIEHGDGLDDELDLADGSFGMEDREDMALDKTVTVTDTHMDEKPLPSMKMQKLSSRVEQSAAQEIDELGDLKAARSRENSKARSESSRDYQKLRDSIDEEVVQHHGRSTHTGNLKRPRGEDEQSARRKSRDEKHVTEKHRMVGKGWEDSYARRDLDPHLARHPHMKTEGIDRRKERDNSEGVWQRQDEDPQGRRARAEDTRKRDRGDELGLSHRNKVRQEENMDKDEHLQLRKQLDNGYSRGYHDKEVGSRPRERDDYLKSRYENIDDLYSKRRKEEHFRRDAEKEEILQNHRENISRRRRERDGSLDLRKRDDQARTLDDNHHSVRHKEDGWMRREMDERQKERDVLHKIKQSREESLSKREREGGRGGLRSGRAAEDKTWVTHARVKDEHKDSDRDYQFKDTGRHNEQLKRRDRAEDGSLSQHRGHEDVHSRGSQLNNDERRSLQERESTRSERAVGGSDNNRVHEKKRKENTRKSKDSEGGDRNSVGPLKRNQGDQSGHMNEPVMSKGITEQGKHRADAASSDDEQRDSRRGRSKLERWTSHKEMDFTISSKSSSSLKAKETGKHKTGGSSIASKLPEESLKTMETTDNQHPLGDQEDVDPEIKNVDVKSVDDRHSDTVAKLKKRSERFKLPMPSEKEAAVIKKMESEPLPSAQGEVPQSEARAESEIKLERPPRKRRWISN